jgi:hypothetical protein
VRLPGLEAAEIDPAKIRGYLLSPWHPLGKFKAAFFAELGYSAGDWQRLAEDLQRHAREHPARLARFSLHGQKYEIRGRLVGPSGSTAVVVAIWIVLRGERHPRFVTAYPRARP